MKKTVFMHLEKELVAVTQLDSLKEHFELCFFDDFLQMSQQIATIKPFYILSSCTLDEATELSAFTCSYSIALVSKKFIAAEERL